MKKLLGIMVLGLFALELNVGAREVLESKKLDAWKVDGKFIIPECLVYEWYSGDNYEEFYEKYFNKKGDHADPKFKNFIKNIGLFLNKEVPLKDTIKTGWSSPNEEISLTKNVSDCLSKNPETYVTGPFIGTYDGYKVIKTIDIQRGLKLAPNISQEFLSIKFIERINRPGRMGSRYHYNIYGIINLNGEKIIVPLKNEQNNKSVRKKF